MGAGYANNQRDGFTLIELSIVLVIIGLIVGGVLVGQNLISAAGVRATVTQIEKYNTAANTFREKYGFLPGDINASAAAQFGFAARGSYTGEGDGNGLLEGIVANAPSANNGFSQTGETLMFWVDLSTAHLIDNGFTTATATWIPSSPYPSGSTLNAYLPPAKLGNGNYIYTFSGGWLENAGSNNSRNYFGLALVTSIGQGSCPSCIFSQAGLTVQQAQNIDQKVDDGLPFSGRVLSAYLWSNNWFWGNNNFYANEPPPTSTFITPSSTTCSDNNGNSANPVTYSVEVNGGTGVNCALVFQMQAGD
jgi:prepilin-type N-terminal cleavage/methylation domain-containing protein